MKVAALWDKFKKLMPEESTRVISYKRDGINLNSLVLSMKDGRNAVFTLGAHTFTYIKRFD